MVKMARGHGANGAILGAALKMASELRRTKYAAEDVLVAFVLDCERWAGGSTGFWARNAGWVTGQTRSRRRIIGRG